jgi:hypothetical protein
MYPHSPLWHYLWLAPHLIQFGIAGLMIRRRLHREFPIFFTYTLVQAIETSLLFYLDHDPNISVSTYWNCAGVGVACDAALRFGVIYEVFSNLVGPYPALKRMTRQILGWSGAILLVIAVAAAWFAPGVGVGWMTYGYHIIDRTVDLVQSGLLVFLFLFASYFGITWRNYVFGIALGMGIFSSSDLITLAIRLQQGPFVGDEILNIALMGVYHMSVLIWLTYLLAPESMRQQSYRVPDHNLEQWNTELERLLLQ